MARLKVTQNRSAADRGSKQRGTMRALGIKRVGQSVIHDDKPEIRGMIAAVGHLVTVEEVTGGGRGEPVRRRSAGVPPKKEAKEAKEERKRSS